MAAHDRLHRYNGLAHANLGAILGRRGAYTEAIGEFRAAVGSEPNQPGLLNNYGVTLRLAGRIDEAVEIGRLAVAEKPDTPLFHDNLAVALTAKGLFDEAIAEYQSELSLQPTNLQERIRLGRIGADLAQKKGAGRRSGGGLAR